MNLSQKHFLMTGALIILWLQLLMFVIYIDLHFSIFLIALVTIFLWAFGEYSHRIILFPIHYKIAFISGKMAMLKKVKKDLEKIDKKKLK